MSEALHELGARPAAAPALTLSQSRALADLIGQARRVASITGQDQMAVLLDRPPRVHQTTMYELVQRGLCSGVRCLRQGRGRRPNMRLRWRLTAAGLRVAASACPAAEVGGAG
jgi:hypothetical protein